MEDILHQQRNNEILTINLIKTTLVLNNTNYGKNLSLNKYQQLFESVSKFEPTVNFNGSVLFQNEPSFIPLMESKDIIGLLNTSTAKDVLVKFTNNNLYSYLSKINEMVNDTNNGLVAFFESDEMNPLNEIKKLIKQILVKLQKQNDFNQYKNKYVINARMMQQNIQVNGFNIFDVIGMDSLKTNKIDLIMFDHNRNNIVIGVATGDKCKILTYDIRKDEISEYLVDYYSGDYISPTIGYNFSELNQLKEVIKSNLQILYIDTSKFEEFKVGDNFNNVFNDQKNTKILEEYKKQQTKKSNPSWKGYLVK